MTSNTDSESAVQATARVVAVQEDIVTIESIGGDGQTPLVKNEVVYICHDTPERSGGRLEKLQAEVAMLRPVHNHLRSHHEQLLQTQLEEERKAVAEQA